MTERGIFWRTLAVFGVLFAISQSEPAFARAAPVTPQSAARKFLPQVKWRNEVLKGDFTCLGKTQFALLGTTDLEFVVIVFTDGLKNKPFEIRFSGKTRNPYKLKLTRESLDFTSASIEKAAGRLPEGLAPSKTCSGLTLSDDEVNPAHIYWNRKTHKLSAWTLPN